jgi:small subunit ribosomal protein S2
MKELLECGVHFGHQTRRWNPKMAEYIFAERNGIYIIDLQKTLRMLETAVAYVQDVAANGGSVLFVGTKRQSQEAVRAEAVRCSMYHVNHRWLGGMLTNFQTIRRSINRLDKLDADEANGVFEQMPKKEVIRLRREKGKLDNNLSGIREMKRLPEVVVVTDTRKEHTAIAEANKLGIPIIAIVDTNCDPDPIDLPVPGNDDAIRSIRLICSVLAESVIQGRGGASEGEQVSEDAAQPDAVGPVDAVLVAERHEEESATILEEAQLSAEPEAIGDSEQRQIRAPRQRRKGRPPRRQS